MNKIITFAATLLAATTGTASAFDLGNTGVALDNSLVAEYNINSTNYTINYSAKLNYNIVDSVNMYVKTSVDLTNITYSGVTLGATWAAKPNLDIYTNVGVDNNGNIGNAIIGAKLNF